MSEILSIDIRFACPECRSMLRVDAAGAGQHVACPCCNRPIQVPPLSEQGEPDPRIQSIQIRFLCPECHQKLRSEAADAGQSIHCTHCWKSIRIPPAPDWTRRMKAKPLEPAAAAIPAPVRVGVLSDEEIDFMTKPGGE
jgi:hypothetical protein